MRKRLANTADEIETDVMGSVHARLSGRGAGPCLMLSAHMDEIGLMVTYISDEGFLSVAAVGGVDAAILPGLRVDVHASNAFKPLRGVVGRKPIHLIDADERKKVTPIDQLVIDVGLPAKKVRKLVCVGDVVTFGVGFERFGKGMAVSRAFDDKAGVWVATRAMEELARAGRAQGDFVVAATVQEEIGVRGATTSAYGVRPDVAVAFDVTHATDYPGISRRSSAGSSAARALSSRAAPISTPRCSSGWWPPPRPRAFPTRWRPNPPSPAPTRAPSR